MTNNLEITNQVESMAIPFDNLRQVVSSYTVSLELNNHKYDITVPILFVYDGASIPRIFWPLGSPYDYCYDSPSCVHDYLYRKQSNEKIIKDNKEYVTMSRRDSDKIYKKLLRRNGNGKIKSAIIYCIVRVFGWMYYKKK